MKGLLRKELYLLSRVGVFFVVLTLLFALLGAVNAAEMGGFFVTFALIYVPLGAYSLFSYEEKWRWSSFVLCAPVTRFQVVLAKYIVTLGQMLVTAVVYAVASQTLQNPVWMEHLLYGLAVSFGLGAISFPLIFFLGTEKARAVSVGLCAAVGGVMGTIVGMADESTMGFVLGHISPLVPAIAFLMFALSCPISAWLYGKRKK